MVVTKVKVGDVVDAYDLRDGALVERARTVLKIKTQQIPQLIDGKMTDVPKTFVLLKGTDYWIPLRCVRPERRG
jgi:hypothetical protein